MMEVRHVLPLQAVSCHTTHEMAGLDLYVLAAIHPRAAMTAVKQQKLLRQQ